jgi:hypothetical protein
MRKKLIWVFLAVIFLVLVGSFGILYLNNTIIPNDRIVTAAKIELSLYCKALGQNSENVYNINYSTRLLNCAQCWNQYPNKPLDFSLNVTRVGDQYSVTTRIHLIYGGRQDQPGTSNANLLIDSNGTIQQANYDVPKPKGSIPELKLCA